MRVLISVTDKSGIVEFSKKLTTFGYEIISTGGTAKVLSEANVPVIPIEKVTDFPEMLNGRVKTLHPKIHGGLLALRDNETHMATCKDHDIKMIDMVVINLYPFEQTIKKPNVSFDQAIENIDIGGPSMIRSAAKNHTSVAVVVKPSQYDRIIEELSKTKGSLSDQTKSQLAAVAFSYTAHYDAMISDYLLKQNKLDPMDSEVLTPALTKVATLRYGENPHQQAAYFRLSSGYGLSNIEQLHGKELSYNNYIDLDAAWSISKSFTEPAVAIIKHTNPCGAAVGETILDAYKKAYSSDPISAFGSIIGINQAVGEALAQEIHKTFVEAVIAPDFSQEAITLLSQKPSIRLIRLKTYFSDPEPRLFRHINGGMLVQTPDIASLDKQQITSVTDTPVPDDAISDLWVSFTLVEHVKSNAIVLVKGGKIIGVGAGQMSRIDAVNIALEKAGDDAKGAVAASDAFFPFHDCVDLLAEHGISAIIQPGGSKRDQESIDACNSHNIPMVLTHSRHFKH